MLTKNLKLIATGISIALITTACASKQNNSTLNTRLEFEKALEKAPKFKQKLAKDKAVRTGRELTLSYYADERRSAAIEEGGYRHTLGNNNPNFNSEIYPANVRYDLKHRNSFLTPVIKNRVKDSFGTSSHTKDYSYYELGRWQRLCDGTNGRTMDKLDWRFVKRNQNRFPIELMDGCMLPTTAVLSKHGIRSTGELNSKRLQVNGNLPEIVYVRIEKDHEPANTPIPVIKSEPVIPCFDCPPDKPKKTGKSPEANNKTSKNESDDTSNIREDIFVHEELKKSNEKK